jgi:hypothetical protein
MVVYTCNPSTQEAEARGSHVGSQPGIHSKTSVSKQQNQNNPNNKQTNKILTLLTP